MNNIRLLKVIVQPVFILDDGEFLSEVDHGPVTIPARDWPSYSGERFPEEVKAWRKRLEEFE